LNKRPLLVLSVLALAVVLMAACAPATLQPTAAPAPTTAPAAAPATELAPQPTAAAPEPTAAAPVATVAAAPDTRPIVPAPVEGQRPLADLPPEERLDRFSGPAAPATDPKVIYQATIVTDKGNIVAELYQDTPGGTNNFVTLAQNGYYDGLTFHRVEPGFVIQGGDPAGDGSGGPGYTIPAEINHLHNKGALAWARTGDQINPERASSGSQFYVTLDKTPFLDGGYSVFGQVIEGMDVAEKIAVGDKIQKIEISQATASLMPTPEPTAVPNPPVAAEGRPLAKLKLEDRSGAYNAAPAMTIDPAKTYQATLETDKGNIVVELDPKSAPATVNNFVLLSDLGFYDGMPVAHVQEDGYLVTGSPNKRPDSDVGYTLPAETGVTASQVVTGTVSMYPVQDPATGEPKASGSQFFISFVQTPEGGVPLNIFGKVVEGMEVVTKLAIDDIVKTITISEK
jgi:cyclophilin family peptidyl-prolyl cis-trans isomerase/Na+-transporting methylmalonyl-CoA/oxaloacetate decarboxylase gamma subunit